MITNVIKKCKISENDNISLYKVFITENYIVNQLLYGGYLIYYWQGSGKAEFDYLLYTNDAIILVEIKAGDIAQSKSLNV